MKKGLVLLSLMVLGMTSFGATKSSTKASGTLKSGKKVMKQKREDLFESLEEKVFRAPNGDKAKLAATDNAFDIGKKRMYYLQREEDEIKAIEAEMGMEDAEHNFLCEKYDGVMEQFKDVKNEIDVLTVENKKLKEYMARLNAMEIRANGGKIVK